MIRERAASAERQRQPDDEVIDALAATGVFRSFVPKRYGGYEVIDTWHVDGMAATGSQEIVVTDAFVPERYASLPLGR